MTGTWRAYPSCVQLLYRLVKDTVLLETARWCFGEQIYPPDKCSPEILQDLSPADSCRSREGSSSVAVPEAPRYAKLQRDHPEMVIVTV